MRHHLSAYLFTVLILYCSTTWSQGLADTDEQQDLPQYVDFGLFAGPTLSGCLMNYNGDGPDKIRPALGFDVGAWMGYHINNRWCLTFAVSSDCERFRLVKNDTINRITSFGIAVSPALLYQTASGWFFSTGPYAHFILASHINGDGNPTNPFSRTFGDDPRTDQPLFSLSNINAGIALTSGYQFPSHWQLLVNYRWGVTDLLNSSSHQYYVHPYRLTICLAHQF